jgi:hypothetical protein
MLVGATADAAPDAQRAFLEGPWDIISLSLVINFVPDPRSRGEMLRKAHTLLKAGGLLFIVVGHVVSNSPQSRLTLSLASSSVSPQLKIHECGPFYFIDVLFGIPKTERGMEGKW